MASAGDKAQPQLKIRHFEGPLDLLCHLIDQNEVDIYDIPILEITEQYLAYLADLDAIDMDSVSDFLLMAATLLQIKSRLLLPQKEQSASAVDPREDLVLSLLAYKRCKTIAGSLKERFETFAGSQVRLPEPIARLGIRRQIDREIVSQTLFQESVERLNSRNKARFQNLAAKLAGILQREKISLKEKMIQIWQKTAQKTHFFFHELFPLAVASRREQVVGFLAVLELLRLNRIEVEQERPFADLLIKRSKQPEGEDWNGISLPRSVVEEEDYA